jgi:hypothetical protein
MVLNGEYDFVEDGAVSVDFVGVLQPPFESH